MRRKSGGNSKMKTDRVSLNPEREMEDEKDADFLLQDPMLKEQLESVWYCALHNGEPLRKERCDVPRFRLLVEASGFATTDRQMNVALRNFGMQADEDDKLTLRGFIKALVHLATDRFATAAAAAATPESKLPAVRMLLDQHMLPYVDRYRAANAHDGSGPDDALLNIPEIDRLLYVYDAVFERMFMRYRDVDHHQTRELTLEQVKLLDQFMEVDEMKEFLKDFGIFPRHISFVELSKASQWACFGRLVADPTKQGTGRTSNIEASKKDSPAVGVNVAAAAENGAAAGGGEGEGASTPAAAVNALHMPQLPVEFQTTEVLLDKPRFMSCVLRLAQMMYSRPEFSKTLPSIVSRAEEFLNSIGPVYERMFNKTMESDCDFSEKGVPLLNNISPSAALQPDHGPIEGGIEVQITGSNFCEKRGVFVRFGSSGNVVVRAKSIAKKKILVDAPTMTPDDVEVDVDFHHGAYHIHIQKVAKVAVECSNNRWQYSETDPTQCFTFRGEPVTWTFDVELSARLMKLFGAACAMDGGGGGMNNSKLMNRARWKDFKRIAGLSEVVQRGNNTNRNAHSNSNSNSLQHQSQQQSATTGQDNDAFFLELAEYHDAEHDLSLTFKVFLRVVSRTLYEMHGEAAWRQHVDELAMIQLEVQRHVVQAGPVVEQNENVLARRAISMVERRSDVALDVFMGPVLCGVLRSRQGDVSSSYSGHKTVFVSRHPFLSYDHMEINTESCVMRHLEMSYSITHFMQRLRKDGFDFASHHPKPTTRKPAGRCWTLFLGDAVLGAIWDYEGNFSCLAWQPAEKEMFNAKITMTIYEEEQSINFVACYLHFQKAKDVQQLRSQLENKGFVLKTKLYRVP